MVIEPRCARHGSLDQVCRSTLRFPPQGPPGRVPLLQRYYQSATTPCRPSRRASFPSLGGTSVSLVGFAPRRTSAPSRPGVGHPVTPAGIWPRRRQGLPSSWGISIVRLPCSKPTPAGLLAPDQYSAAAWPLVFQKQRLPRKVFRRSIAWLSDSLSTLRSAGYPNPTQDSLPAAGQALPDGLSTRKTPLRGFRSASYISFLLSQASWHNEIDRRSVRSETGSASRVRRVVVAERSLSANPTHKGARQRENRRIGLHAGIRCGSWFLQPPGNLLGNCRACRLVRRSQ